MLFLALLFILCLPLFPQQPFVTRCAPCHGADARGTAQAPGLALNPRVAEQSVDQLRAYLEHGNPGAGMPSFSDLPAADLTALVTYLRRINVNTILQSMAPPALARKLTWGPPQPGDWLTYNGNLSANRYSPLDQIRVSNVSSLKLQWVFPLPYFGLETTPLAADGVLYVTGPNQVFALDAADRRSALALFPSAQLPACSAMPPSAPTAASPFCATKSSSSPTTPICSLSTAPPDSCSGTSPSRPPCLPANSTISRGTVAPLIVDDMVIAGVAGADHGIRGFVAAFQAATGEPIWRRWTVPRRGEPGIETWRGSEPVTGGGSTWFTGSYDPSSDTLYWATGNPWPDGDDRDRPGDNLYTNCVLALDPANRRAEMALPVHAARPEGSRCHRAQRPGRHRLPRQALQAVAACRSQRLLLRAGPDRWPPASGQALPAPRRLGYRHRRGWPARWWPIPAAAPSDAANWDSTAFSPATGLYYLMALEECTGKPTGYPDQTGQRFLRALNIETGEIVWEVPQPGPARAKTWSGVLATAGGLVFYGQPNGGFAAVDQRSGHTLWQFPTNARMKASPMTFTVGGKQYVAVAAGPNILCFAL